MNWVKKVWSMNEKLLAYLYYYSNIVTILHHYMFYTQESGGKYKNVTYAHTNKLSTIGQNKPQRKFSQLENFLLRTGELNGLDLLN